MLAGSVTVCWVQVEVGFIKLPNGVKLLTALSVVDIMIWKDSVPLELVFTQK